MGILPIILSCFLITEISAFYGITQVKGIQEQLVTNVNFDAEGNTYVVGTSTGDSDYHLYKLNSSSEILWSMDLPYFVSEMLVSKAGDAYFQFYHDDIRTLGIVRDNSTEVELISEMYYEFFHMDYEGNLFYCKETGVYVLRPETSASVLITNLENYVSLPSGIAISDRSGNTYIPVLSPSVSKLSLAVITKKALQDEKPNAMFIYSEPNLINDLSIDKDGNLWISVVGNKNLEGIIKRLVNGKWETVLTDPDRPFNTMLQTKEKTYIIASDLSYTVSRIYFIASNNEVVDIPELNNLTTRYVGIKGMADTEGQVYFYGSYGDELSSSLGRMITIKSNESNPTPINFGNYTGAVRNLEVKLDFLNDVWILESIDDIYHLDKGETVSEALQNPNGICLDYFGIDVNFITQKVYVSCANGLFIADFYAAGSASVPSSNALSILYFVSAMFIYQYITLNK